MSFNPVAVAREAVLHEETDGWHAGLALRDEDRVVAATAVQNLGDVDPDDYCRFTVRLEVIETVYYALSR